MIHLTQEQHDELARNGTGPIRVFDHAASAEYVLVPVQVYEKWSVTIGDFMPGAAALVNEVMAEDEANDPFLDSYQNYA